MSAKDSGRDRNVDLRRMDSRNLSRRNEFFNSQCVKDPFDSIHHGPSKSYRDTGNSYRHTEDRYGNLNNDSSLQVYSRSRFTENNERGRCRNIESNYRFATERPRNTPNAPLDPKTLTRTPTWTPPPARLYYRYTTQSTPYNI